MFSNPFFRYNEFQLPFNSLQKCLEAPGTPVPLNRRTEPNYKVIFEKNPSKQRVRGVEFGDLPRKDDQNELRGDMQMAQSAMEDGLMLPPPAAATAAEVAVGNSTFMNETKMLHFGMGGEDMKPPLRLIFKYLHKFKNFFQKYFLKLRLLNGSNILWFC